MWKRCSINRVQVHAYFTCNKANFPLTYPPHTYAIPCQWSSIVVTEQCWTSFPSFGLQFCMRHHLLHDTCVHLPCCEPFVMSLWSSAKIMFTDAVQARAWKSDSERVRCFEDTLYENRQCMLRSLSTSLFRNRPQMSRYTKAWRQGIRGREGICPWPIPNSEGEKGKGLLSQKMALFSPGGFTEHESSWESSHPWSALKKKILSGKSLGSSSPECPRSFKVKVCACIANSWRCHSWSGGEERCCY